MAPASSQQFYYLPEIFFPQINGIFNCVLLESQNYLRVLYLISANTGHGTSSQGPNSVCSLFISSWKFFFLELENIF